MGSDSFKVSENELRQCCLEALKREGVPDDHAEMATEIFVRADLQGIYSHGTRFLNVYIKRIRCGLINPRPTLAITAPAPALRLLDGDHGFGPVVTLTGLREGIKVARETGICFVGCKNSNHFGAGAPYALEACREGMILLGGSNAFPTMAPTGGKKALVGNNPIFIGIPRRDPPHVIVDFGLSVAARGKIRAAAERGEPIPEGWALGPDGKPTTDAAEGLKGLVVPIADHKGYALAVAVDMLAGVLTGSGYGPAVLSTFQSWQGPQLVGHFFIVLRPDLLMPMEEFYERQDEMLATLLNCPTIEPDGSIMYPGEKEAATMERQQKQGIDYEEAIWEMIQALARGEYEFEES